MKHVLRTPLFLKKLLSDTNNFNTPIFTQRLCYFLYFIEVLRIAITNYKSFFNYINEKIANFANCKIIYLC